LSNVHNRKNIKGIDTIKNLEFIDNKVHIIYTNNIITHIIGIFITDKDGHKVENYAFLNRNDNQV
jgi:hypothetical protein